MLNSDVYWITCEMVVTCDLLCWITMILACMLVGLKSLMIALDYRSYMGSSARIWSLRWLFLYLCSYNLDGSITMEAEENASLPPRSLHFIFFLSLAHEPNELAQAFGWAEPNQLFSTLVIMSQLVIAPSQASLISRPSHGPKNT
jgi:hypothetical protein